MKSSKGRQWRELAYHWEELANQRGAALSRLWLTINSSVHDETLAAELQLAIIGGLLPDLEINSDGEGESE